MNVNPVVYGVLFIVLAPVFGGLLAGLDRIISARMQSRVGPPLLQPFYDLGKLLQKDARQVNPIAEPLLLGHVGFMAATGAMLARRHGPGLHGLRVRAGGPLPGPGRRLRELAVQLHSAPSAS